MSPVIPQPSVSWQHLSSACIAESNIDGMEEDNDATVSSGALVDYGIGRN